MKVKSWRMSTKMCKRATNMMIIASMRMRMRRDKYEDEDVNEDENEDANETFCFKKITLRNLKITMNYLKFIVNIKIFFSEERI